MIDLKRVLMQLGTISQTENLIQRKQRSSNSVCQNRLESGTFLQERRNSNNSTNLVKAQQQMAVPQSHKELSSPQQSNFSPTVNLQRVVFPKPVKRTTQLPEVPASKQPNSQTSQSASNYQYYRPRSRASFLDFQSLDNPEHQFISRGGLSTAATPYDQKDSLFPQTNKNSIGPSNDYVDRQIEQMESKLNNQTINLYNLYDVPPTQLNDFSSASNRNYELNAQNKDGKLKNKLSLKFPDQEQEFLNDYNMNNIVSQTGRAYTAVNKKRNGFQSSQQYARILCSRKSPRTISPNAQNNAYIEQCVINSKEGFQFNERNVQTCKSNSRKVSVSPSFGENANFLFQTQRSISQNGNSYNRQFTQETSNQKHQRFQKNTK